MTDFGEIAAAVDAQAGETPADARKELGKYAVRDQVAVLATQEAATGGSGAILKSTPVMLDDEQIKALPGTDVELVAAPGSGKIILPLKAFLIQDFAVAYSGIDANTEYPAIWIAHSTNPIYLTEFIDQPAAEGGSSLTPFLTATNEFGRNASTLEILTSMAVRGTSAGEGQPFSAVAQSGPSSAFYPDTQADTSLKIGADNSGNFTGGDPANTLIVTVLYTVLDV